MVGTSVGVGGNDAWVGKSVLVDCGIGVGTPHPVKRSMSKVNAVICFIITFAWTAPLACKGMTSNLCSPHQNLAWCIHSLLVSRNFC